jgi:hypothetical protein
MCKSDLNHIRSARPPLTIQPMPSPRYKILRFHCESLGASADTPACEDVQLIAQLEAEDGSIIERTAKLLVYPRIMSDPGQFPHLIAGTLRSMMIQGEPGPDFG